VNRQALTLEQQFARTDALGRLIAFGLAAAMAWGALAVSFLVTPEEIDSGRVVLSPPCTFKQMLGAECPSCGLSRSFAALSHGKWSDSLGYNRAGPVIYAAFWLGGAAALWAAARAAADLRRATTRARR
jgi:hypothetical protein